jgi:hypothetical protein
LEDLYGGFHITLELSVFIKYGILANYLRPKANNKQVQKALTSSGKLIFSNGL